MSDTYTLYQRGCALLASGDAHAACVALTAARDSAPDKASIREALGRALFRTRAFEAAAAEFEAVLAIDPVNDYAHFGLGLAYQRLGDRTGAARHLKLAVAMRPSSDAYGRALERLTGEGPGG